MLNLNEAIESRLFYVLDAPVRALQPPVRTLRLFQKADQIYIWQLAVAGLKKLSSIGLTQEEIDQITVELQAQGLQQGMQLEPLLMSALMLGKFSGTRTPEYINRTVPLLMEYCRQNPVSERTREMVLLQRDMVSGVIEDYRRRFVGVYNTRSIDQDGLPQFITMVLPPF